MKDFNYYTEEQFWALGMLSKTMLIVLPYLSISTIVFCGWAALDIYAWDNRGLFENVHLFAAVMFVIMGLMFIYVHLVIGGRIINDFLGRCDDFQQFHQFTKNNSIDGTIYHLERTINCEKDFQKEIADKIKKGQFKLNGEILKPIEGVQLREYQTGIGLADIIAQGEQCIYLIEIKVKNRTGDKTVGQVLRYYKALSENDLISKPVKPVILAKSMDSQLVYSSQAVSELELYQWVQFMDKKTILIHKMDDDKMRQIKSQKYSGCFDKYQTWSNIETI